MREAARITTYFAPLAEGELGSFSLTDDAAVLQPPPGKTLVLTTDSVIVGTHVLPNASAAQVARKLVRRNLSDLAAMGAAPWRYLLNLHTPAAIGDDWFAEFSAALKEEQEQFGMVLAGGDSTSGDTPVHATLTCLGLLEGEALRRDRARSGDDLYVSGTIGDAALGLLLLTQSDVENSLTERYWKPTPRLALGAALRGIASACIDCSDGLVMDATRIATASNLGLVMMRDAVPLSPAATRLIERAPQLWQAILAGGDDYELIFTAPPEHRDALDALAGKLDLPLTRIGTVMEPEDGINVIDALGDPVELAVTGWEHE